MNTLYYRIKEQHTSAYLTLMSIIQGVALSFFTFLVVNEYQNFTDQQIIIVACTFSIIILTWFEYVTGISMFIWLHGVLDSIIPFFLFTTEIMLIQTMNKTDGSWYLSMSVFCAVALVAFINMYAKAYKENNNLELLASLKLWNVVNLVYIFLSLVLFIVFWKYWDQSIDIILSIGALLVITIFVIFAALYWAKVIKFARTNA